MKDEKKLMTEKEITEAINIRNSMKNESNTFIRNSRMLEIK